ncbi:isoprenyl transferase [Clostridium tepidiprofundi DSM 19306]|uniref:Isoprenyl transferase n=2 Tax=Clostridium TaxID=1485 RepID=A0A151B7M2_9CLOT|nr:isoprenyl transferase [Clostridium tepidiprofundi DSM 19306]
MIGENSVRKIRELFNHFKNKNIQLDNLDSLESQTDKDLMPRHVAIIMDGNGRWAKKRNLPRTVGHRAGVETIREIVKECSNLGIKYLTLYAFSTENWKRPKEEVTTLMKLLSEYLKNEFEELNRNNVVINHIGDISKLPSVCQKELSIAYEKTKYNTGLVLNLALNYGGRNEIVDAVKKISRDISEGRLIIDDIDESIINDYIYTSGMPDPELIIRTSGEIRLSNFLIWQSAYSELYFTDILWPDFNKTNLKEAILDYQKRHRRFGGV